jgi:hypothetical protein
MPFPGPDPPTVPQTKLKNIIFRAMPSIWQTNFLRVNNVSTSSVLTLQQFMSQECEFAEQAQSQNSRGSGLSGSGKRRERESHYPSNRGNTGGRGGRDNMSGQHHNNNNYQNVRPRTGYQDTPCRTHNGTHMWSQCRENSCSQNYNAGRGSSAGRGNPGRGHAGRGNYQPYDHNGNQGGNYFQQENANEIPSGASMLSEVPVEAVVSDAESSTLV